MNIRLSDKAAAEVEEPVTHPATSYKALFGTATSRSAIPA
jgi:hypothetical protein